MPPKAKKAATGAPTPELDQAKVAAIEQLNQVLDEVAGIEIDELAERKELGVINFSAGRPLFSQARDLAAELRSLPLDLLPTDTLKSLVDPVSQLSRILTQIGEFSLSGRSNPEQERDGLLQQAQARYNAFFLAAQQYVAYLSLKSAHVQETMRRAHELLSDTETKVADALEYLQTKQEEADSTLRTIMDAAATTGVGHFTNNFKTISEAHDRQSKGWLIAAGVLWGLTIGAAVLFAFVWVPDGDITQAATLQRIVAKLVALSLLSYGAVWAGKNYRAHRHLTVVNAHRQNALATFQTFVKATDDDQTRNAVLLEATHCIFAPAVSGYLGKDDEAAPNNRVIEVMQTFGRRGE